VFRDSASSKEIGRLLVSTVFREQARGRIVSGNDVRVHDEVRPDTVTYLAALRRQVEALRDRGDLAAAREAARRALSSAASTAEERAEQRNMLELFAALDYQAGAIDAALEHLRAATESAAAQAGTLNSLGALYSVRGDYANAEAAILEAAAKAQTDPLLRVQIRNNLGVLAELRGNARQAEAYYKDALESSSSLDRLAIQANLARVQKLK
jgi:Flp pilus assembly protein TadD